MQQQFEHNGKVASVYSTSDGKLAFGEIIETFINKSCKAAVFDSISDSKKGKLDRRTTTPTQETIDLLCNPPEFLGNTDGRLLSARLTAGTVQMFISGRISPSNSPIKVKTPKPENLSYLSKLISRDGKFTLDDFEQQIYEASHEGTDQPQDEDQHKNKSKRQKTNDDKRLIVATTEQQMNTVMQKYVDANVIAYRPFKCSLEAVLRQGIDEQDFIQLSMEYTDKVAALMNIQMPLLLIRAKTEHEEKILITKTEQEEKLLKTKTEQEEKLLKTKTEQQEKLLKTKTEEEGKIEQKKREEFEKMKLAEEKVEIQKQTNNQIDLKMAQECTKQASIQAKLESKRLVIEEKQAIADINGKKDENYRLNLEAQLNAVARAAAAKQLEKNSALKKDYVEAFIGIMSRTKFLESMCGPCNSCTGRVAHFGSARILKPHDGSTDRLFCAKCAKSAKKKNSGEFLPMPKLEHINLSTWIQVNGPHFSGVCVACTHPLEYVNYHMAHIFSRHSKAPKELENLLPSCLSCNNSNGVKNFEEFIKKRYPNTPLQMLSHTQAKQAARVMLCRTVSAPVDGNVLNHTQGCS